MLRCVLNDEFYNILICVYVRCLTGALQNYDQLKTHTGVLESLIASKESSSVEMTSQAQQEVLQRERNIDELQGNVKTLQEALQKEKSLAKELKKQVPKRRSCK